MAEELMGRIASVLAKTNGFENPGPFEYEQASRVAVLVAPDRDLLLWLHAEAAHLNEWYLKTGRIQQRWVDEDRAEVDRLTAELKRVEASRQAWAEEGAHLKRAALDSVDRIAKRRDGLAYGPDDNRWQITRHHAYTEALAVLGSCFDAIMDDWPTAEAKRVCACVSAEQAVQIAAAGPLWSLPQCGVHLEGESQ